MRKGKRDPGLARALERLAAWQASRMGRTYADLAAQPRYADAIAFFQSDLYGASDFAQRDADLARVVPIMTRMLPGRVIATVAQAMELNALSHELDRALLQRLPRRDGSCTVAEYCAAYRRPGDRAARDRQIGLIGEIGAGLDDYVRKPLIHSALVMMRHPARLAGVSVLHDFLERGFVAFRKMHGASEFLATIDRARAQAHGGDLRRRDGALPRAAPSGRPRRSGAARWRRGDGERKDATSPCRSTCRTACALRPRCSASAATA